MLDAELPLTVGEWEEWGNPLADVAAYWRMLSYSPYDNVAGHNADGSVRTYPDLLVTAGLNDPRVSYWEPAKWVAKLRHLSPATKGVPPHRAGGRPRRALRSLRLVEGGGAGAGLRPRRAGNGHRVVECVSA